MRLRKSCLVLSANLHFKVMLPSFPLLKAQAQKSQKKAKENKNFMETFWLHRLSLNIKPRASLTITQQRNSSLEFRLPGSKKKTYNIQKANCSIWFLLSILARKSGQAQKKRSTMNLDVFVISLFLLLFMMFHDFFFRLRQMLVYLHQHNQVVEGKRRVLFYFKRQQGIWKS